MVNSSGDAGLMLTLLSRLGDSERIGAAQAERSHLESSIRHFRCDLDFTTLRRGSPHSLVCTKNQASYERRALQRKDDLEALARQLVVRRMTTLPSRIRVIGCMRLVLDDVDESYQEVSAVRVPSGTGNNIPWFAVGCQELQRADFPRGARAQMVEHCM
jgi:hypothetical protein